MFAGEEVEITVKSIEPLHKELSTGQKKLLEMVSDNRKNAPLIALDVDVRSLIDDSHFYASNTSAGMPNF